MVTAVKVPRRPNLVMPTSPRPNFGGESDASASGNGLGLQALGIELLIAE